jgi:hypothetical protein
VRGRATFTVDGQATDAPAGTLVHVTAAEKRTAVAEEAGTIVLAIGAPPGEAYQPSGWTSFVVADALRREGRIEEGRTAIRGVIDRFPTAWHAPYNAACYEALVGDADAAFQLLEDAMRIDAQSARRHAAGDPDFESLHDDPRWQRVAR